jgi:hypothetical protein
MTVDFPGSVELTSSYFRCRVYFDANADANRRSILDHTGPTTTRDGPLMASEGREALGYYHGYDGEIFYLSLALDPAYVEGFVEGCLERIGFGEVFHCTSRKCA